MKNERHWQRDTHNFTLFFFVFFSLFRKRARKIWKKVSGLKKKSFIFKKKSFIFKSISLPASKQTKRKLSRTTHYPFVAAAPTFTWHFIIPYVRISTSCVSSLYIFYFHFYLLFTLSPVIFYSPSHWKTCLSFKCENTKKKQEKTST